MRDDLLGRHLVALPISRQGIEPCNVLLYPESLKNTGMVNYNALFLGVLPFPPRDNLATDTDVGYYIINM